MDPDLKPALKAAWSRPVTRENPRLPTTPADLRQLSDHALEQLSSLFQSCFSESAGSTVPVDDLATFFDAITFAEYRFDGVNLWPPELRGPAWQRAADDLGWPVDRLHHVADWWYRTAEHQDFNVCEPFGAP